MPNEFFWSWLAGFIDGDGCIGIRNLGGKRKGKVARYGVRVHIANTNEDVLDYIKKQVGYGCVYCVNKANQYGNRKALYNYEISNRQAIDFLTNVIPYLRIKKAQAELAFQYQKTKRWGRKEVPEKVLGIRAEIRKKFKALNRKGVNYATT